jgi:predicted transcriptional regulator
VIKRLDEAVALTPRDKIFSTIGQNPGLHFREIQRRVGYATGAMQYHIDYLKKKGYIREEKEGKFSRFYALESGNVDSKLMGLLRQESVRRITLFLMNKRKATLPVISGGINLGLSTTSFHMQKLIQAGFVSEIKKNGKAFYSLNEKERILTLLVQYRHSFLDELVDNFIDIWEKELKP